MRSLSPFRRVTSFAVLGLLLCAASLYAQTPLAEIEPNSVRVGSAGVSCNAASGQVPAGLCTSDWSSIRAAYEANRHAAFATDDGHQARNPGQQWLTRFDGRGFSTHPDEGGWTWGLQLERYGFAGEERDVCEPMQVSAQGQRVAYDWDATLQEWYVNDGRGLEHGFTVHTRPPQAHDAPLTFTLAVRGDLQASVQDDGRGVSFSNDDGVVLTYAGLVVFDADGQPLASRFERIAEGLLLTVDERGARYPLTIDPIAQQAYLKASNTGANDGFGSSVSVSGDTVVVGAYVEDSNATGVNGNQADNSADGAGAAYVFVRSGTTWSQQAYLKASNTDAADHFGISLELSGETLVVGAWDEDSGATGVNGNQADNSVGSSGAAYVFVRNGTIWSQQAYLKASNTGANDDFGSSVSVSGDTVVVGAVSESSGSDGVNGNQSDNSASQAGAAYVFVRIGKIWSQQAYLKASNSDAVDFFGHSVSGSGNTIVVGAYREASNATGVNGNQADNSASVSGAAYVFVRSGATWSQQAYLKASNTGAGDEFGSVSVSGETIVVGADREDSNATGVNGNQADNSAGNAGAAYVFVRNGTTWSQQAYFKASNTGAGDEFGRVSVSVSGNTVAVGAPLEDSNATGVNGNQADNSAGDSGAAYVFVRSGTTWSQTAYLKASNTEAGDAFGGVVSVSSDTVVVSAIGEDSNATGVNGNQSDNSAPFATGAAYVFKVAQPYVDGFMEIAGVYDNFSPIDFDSHVLYGSAAFSWLVKVDTNSGIAAWATKVHSGSNTVNGAGAGGPWVVANRSTGDIYAAVCPNAGPGTVVSFYERGSMTAVTTRTMTNGSHVYLVKYNSKGVLQWVRHTLYTVTSGPPDTNKLMRANMPNLCLLPSGNVVLGASVQTGNSGLSHATTVKWSDGTNDVIAALLGEPGVVQGVLLEISPAGNFVSSKISECLGGYAGGGSPNTPVVLSPIGNTLGFAVGSLRNFRATIRLGVGEPNEFTAGYLAEYGNVNGHYALYSTAKLLRWAAATVPKNSSSNPYGPNGEPTSVWLDSSGSVYGTDLLWGQTSQPNLMAHLQSAQFSESGAIDVAMPAAGAGSGEGAPVYQKRNHKGLPVWAKGFGPSSVYGDDLPRPIIITVVNDVPWITGVVRKNAGEHLYLDEGLPSEVQLRGDIVTCPPQTGPDPTLGSGPHPLRGPHGQEATTHGRPDHPQAARG